MSSIKAKKYYLNKNINKFNCAQAVIAGFKERFKFDEGVIARFAGFGGGRAPEGECGAYHAAKYILKEGCQGECGDSVEFESNFKTAAGSTKCKEIRQMRRISCVGCVEEASKFIDDKCSVETALSPEAEQSRKKVRIEMISPQDAREAMIKDPDIKIIDVSSVLEFDAIHIEHSANIPIESLGCRLDDLASSGCRYIIVCATGSRAAVAAEMLKERGGADVSVMAGGISRWAKEKLPVTRGKSVISLERQIRVIAGMMVFLGALASLFLNKFFIVIPIFVGCGLTYAGVTNNCMMGMLLMKLPYNKNLYAPKPGSSACSIN